MRTEFERLPSWGHDPNVVRSIARDVVFRTMDLRFKFKKPKLADRTGLTPEEIQHEQTVQVLLEARIRVLKGKLKPRVAAHIIPAGRLLNECDVIMVNRSLPSEGSRVIAALSMIELTYSEGIISIPADALSWVDPKDAVYAALGEAGQLPRRILLAARSSLLLMQDRTRPLHERIGDAGSEPHLSVSWQTLRGESAESFTGYFRYESLRKVLGRAYQDSPAIGLILERLRPEQPARYPFGPRVPQATVWESVRRKADDAAIGAQVLRHYLRGSPAW